MLRVEEILSKLKGHYLFPITVSFTDKKTGLLQESDHFSWITIQNILKLKGVYVISNFR